MKNRFTQVGLALTVIAVLAVVCGCGSDAVGPTTNHQTSNQTTVSRPSDITVANDSNHNRHRHSQEATGELLWFTSETGSPPNYHKFTYVYRDDGTLELEQLTWLAGCCPEDLIVNFDITSGTITISEEMVWPDIILMSLSHLVAGMEIRNLPARQYEIVINLNSYGVMGGPLRFTIDLVNEPSGEVVY